MKKILHVLNGDCAYNSWMRSSLAGDSQNQVLVWRENYLQGPLPVSDLPLEDFCRERASVLIKNLPSLSFEVLFRALRTMEETVLCLSSFSSVVLWFDACMFDQSILAHLLFRFAAQSDRPPVFLVCRDLNWGGEPANFEDGKNSMHLLSDAEIWTGAMAWEGFSNGTEFINKALEYIDFSNFEFLSPALVRYTEEFPLQGLGKTAGNILKILKEGPSTPRSLFASVSALERFPFMGDSSFQEILDNLVRDGLVCVRMTGEENISLLNCDSMTWTNARIFLRPEL